MIPANHGTRIRCTFFAKKLIAHLIDITRQDWTICNADNFSFAQDKHFSWTCELKSSEHTCRIFFDYSKLCVISSFAKKVHYLPPIHSRKKQVQERRFARAPLTARAVALNLWNCMWEPRFVYAK